MKIKIIIVFGLITCCHIYAQNNKDFKRDYTIKLNLLNKQDNIISKAYFIDNENIIYIETNLNRTTIIEYEIFKYNLINKKKTKINVLNYIFNKDYNINIYFQDLFYIKKDNILIVFDYVFIKNQNNEEIERKYRIYEIAIKNNDIKEIKIDNKEKYVDKVFFSSQLNFKENLFVTVENDNIVIFTLFEEVKRFDYPKSDILSISFGKNKDEIIAVYSEKDTRKLIFYNLNNKSIETEINATEDMTLFNKISNDNKFIVFYSIFYNELCIVDLKTNDKMNIITSNDNLYYQINVNDWSEDSKYLLVTIDDLYLIDIEKFLKSNPKRIKL